MKRWSLILVICLLVSLLAGCTSLEDFYELLHPSRDTAFGDMEYTRPDMDALRGAFQSVEDAAPTAKKAAELMDLVNDAYEQYYDFYTAYALAQIHSCADLTQEDWAEENAFCTQMCAEVDGLLDQMLYTLSGCPLKKELEKDRYFGKGFFDAYQGESLWDDTFTELMEQDAQLQNQYYELSTLALESSSYEEYYEVYGLQMAEVFAQMVSLRQRIASYAGYDSYAEFAYDFTYQRDYTPAQAAILLKNIQKELVPLYLQIADSPIWDIAYEYSSPENTLAYTRKTAEKLGGTVLESFELLQKQNLYDLDFSENKYDSSFTIYLINYEEPYIFVNPTLGTMDKLTFVHEFGHFCNDYATYGNLGSVDVAEIFSQGMEYLSLVYSAPPKLEKYKLADCLSVYVEQAAYAAFEEAVYSMEESTVDAISDLYMQIMEDYGMTVWDVDPLSFVTVTHFFTNPMYVLSYVVSNDAAFQLYQMEKAQTGSGAKLYMDCLDSTEPGFLTFVEQAGLTSPFAPERISAVKATLEQMLTK